VLHADARRADVDDARADDDLARAEGDLAAIVDRLVRDDVGAAERGKRGVARLVAVDEVADVVQVAERVEVAPARLDTKLVLDAETLAER
jgi:hypothetical protein